jgi:hypothetical protein
VIAIEPDVARALGVRSSVSAVICDRRRPPSPVLPDHRVRIRAARARRAAAFAR